MNNSSEMASNINGMEGEALADSLKEYVERMIHVRFLSSPELNGITSAEAYSSVLRDNFQNIGTLAENNRELISSVIDPILNSDKPLDRNMIQAIEDLNEQLLDASEVENIDLPLASLLTNRLLADAYQKNDIDYRIGVLDKVIENSYLLTNMTKRVVTNRSIVRAYREKGIAAVTKLLSFLEKDRFLFLSPESREVVMINARYGAAMYEGMDSEAPEWTKEQFQMLERALEIAEDPFYKDAMPDFDWKYHLFRTYEYLTRLDYTTSDEEVLQKGVKYADECIRILQSDPEYYSEFSNYEEIEGRRLRVYYLAGRISNQEYREKLYEMYAGRAMRDYSAMGYDMNVEYPLDYIRFMEEVTEKDITRTDEIYRAVLAYIFHMPKLGLLTATLDPYSRMLQSFREFPGTIDFEEMGIQSLAALHPPTYVHSKMVANITGCLARHLMRIHPELFDDVYTFLGLENRPENQDEIIEYAYHAALCHDFGKLMIIDTIFVYGRKLLDMEFDLVKQHPDMGYALLSANKSTARYAEVARGHHLWYDCSRGYPTDFDAKNSPVKVIIDIVAIADCMDAATDSVGRSYNRGKTLADYEQEVIRDAGTRYAPWGPKLLADEKTRSDLEYLLGEDRMRLYRETYTLLVSLDIGKDQDED